MSLFRKELPAPSRSVVLHVEALEDRTVPALIGVAAATHKVILQAVSSGGFQSFQVTDASHDDSPKTVFAGGALRVNYSIGGPAATARITAQPGTGGSSQPTSPPASNVDHVTIEAWQSVATSTSKSAYSYGASGAVAMVKVADLATFRAATETDGLVNLLDTANLPGGALTIEARAYFKDGSTAVSAGAAITFKTGPTLNGDFRGNVFDLSHISGNGIFINGAGGIDTLNLNIDSKLIASIDGKSLAAFTPTAGGQAIYHGVEVDYIRLTDGREVYFTGIEKLQARAFPTSVSTFVATTKTNGTQTNRVETLQTFDLAVTTNDPSFVEQWNLHITDVPDAWRFTTGASKILLVSLDTGVLTSKGQLGFNNGDLPASRLITDPSDDDNTGEAHGHQAISVMVGVPNNSFSSAGINWGSDVYVTDVYQGVSLQQAIQQAFAIAQSQGLDVVFQGGIQGESWLNNGGSQEDLEKLISSHANGLFVIAAGNGGPGGGLNDPNFATSVSGVAKLESNHINVVSVGALQRTADPNFVSNSSDVRLAAYSNHGSNLTMVAPTDSPATDFDGETTFGGTSCANPNLAAMASLVWSANPLLSAGQVRQILEDTAMDLGDPGRDDTFGTGLVDAGLAVRRATALSKDYYLAMLPLFTAALPAGPSATTIVAHGTNLSVIATKTTALASAVPPSTSVINCAFADQRSLSDVLPASVAAAVSGQQGRDLSASRTNLFAALGSARRQGTDLAGHDGTQTRDEKLEILSGESDYWDTGFLSSLTKAKDATAER